MSEPVTRERPDPTEYAAYYGTYVDLVPPGEILRTLEAQLHATLALLTPVDEATALHRYAPGKWSVKEVLGHVIDSERVFALRALAFSRGERARLFGFEQDDWVAAGGFDGRPLRDLLAEFEAVRRATLHQFAGLDATAWMRRGVANDVEFTVRAVPWILAGHERHHVDVLRKRYL